MDVLYINLKDQTERKNFVEENFRANNARKWLLHRVEAADTQDVTRNAIAGGLRAAQKACWLSHLKALERARDFSGPVLIAEDDILFGANSLATIESTLAAIPETEWDIIFTDAAIGSIYSMIELFALRRRLEGPRLVSLANLYFSGSTAYIVNRAARDKLLALLPRKGPFEIAYDIQLRMLVHEKKLRASAIFPFPTTLSPYADSTSVQTADDELVNVVMNGFRRLMWLERDIASATEAVERTNAGQDDPETAAFAKILAAFLSPRFVAR